MGNIRLPVPPPAPDLTPLQRRLDELQVTVKAVAAQPAPQPLNLAPTHERLAALGVAIEGIRIPAPAPANLAPTEARLTALEQAVRGIVIPAPVRVDLSALMQRLDTSTQRGAQRQPQPAAQRRLRPARRSQAHQGRGRGAGKIAARHRRVLLLADCGVVATPTWRMPTPSSPPFTAALNVTIGSPSRPRSRALTTPRASPPALNLSHLPAPPWRWRCAGWLAHRATSVLRAAGFAPGAAWRRLRPACKTASPATCAIAVPPPARGGLPGGYIGPTIFRSPGAQHRAGQGEPPGLL